MTNLSHAAASAGVVGVIAKNKGAWAGCWKRARSFINAPWLFLPWIFGLIFCAAAYAITDEEEGFVIAAIALAGVVLLAVGGNNVKFWLVLYPLIFLNPVGSLGNWSDSGDKQYSASKSMNLGCSS